MAKWMLNIEIVLVLMLTLSLVIAAEPEKVYTLELQFHSSGSVDLIEFNLIDGISNLESKGGEYSIKVLSGNRVLTQYAIPEPIFEFHGEKIKEDGTREGVDIKRDEVIQFLRVPFYKEGNKFQILRGEEILLEQTFNPCDYNGVCPATFNPFLLLIIVLIILAAIIAYKKGLLKKFKRKKKPKRKNLLKGRKK